VGETSPPSSPSLLAQLAKGSVPGRGVGGAAGVASGRCLIGQVGARRELLGATSLASAGGARQRAPEAAPRVPGVSDDEFKPDLLFDPSIQLLGTEPVVVAVVVRPDFDARSVELRLLQEYGSGLDQ
jgi:hypothetical protein